MKKIFKHILCLLVTAVLGLPVFANAAITDDAMDLYPQEAGTKLFILYYDKIKADSLYANGLKVNDNFNLDANIAKFRGGIYYNIGSFTNLTDVVLPYGYMSADTTVNASSVNMSSPSGLGDLVIHHAVFLLNDAKNQLYGGPDLFITAPTGDYRNNKSLNLSSNRWAFKPGFGIVKGIGSKGTFAQIKASVEFYTTNNDYTVAGYEQKKDPLFQFESFLIQFLDPKTFVSLGYFYFNGGETKVQDIDQNDRTKTHSLQFGITRMITDNTQLMIKYTKDLDVENGSKTDTFGIRLGFLFPSSHKK